MNRKNIIRKTFLYFSLLFAMTCLFSCDLFQSNMKEFFTEYTETAAIMVKTGDEAFLTDPAGFKCLNGELDTTLNFMLRNPQHYDLDFNYVFDDPEIASLSSPADIIFTKSQDKNSVSLTFKNDFTKLVDFNNQKQKNISGRITLTEPSSGRSFESYPLSYRVDTVPPGVEKAMFQTDKDVSDPDCQYIVCFYMPYFGNESVHKNDTRKIIIDGTTYYFKSTAADTFYKTAVYDKDSNDWIYSDQEPNLITSGVTLQPIDSNDFKDVLPPDSIASKTSYKKIYYKTGITPSDNETRSSITISDDAGLSSSVLISTKAKKLTPPLLPRTQDGTADEVSFTADEVTGFYDYIITHNQLATDDSEAGPVYINYTKKNETGTILDQNKIYGSAKIQLEPGKYKITSFASKDLFVASDVKSPNDADNTITIRRPAIYYVSASGSDTEGLGSRQKPYETIQKAIEEIDNNADIDDDTQVYIRLMSNIQVSDTIEFSDAKLSSGRAKNITMEPYGISNAKISLGGIANKILIDENLTTADAKLTLNNLTLENGCTEASDSRKPLIYNEKTNTSLIMNNVTIQNSAVLDLASIVNSAGYAEMNNCTVRNCIAKYNLIVGSNMTVYNCSITGNKARNIVYNNNNMKLIDSTISDNTIATYDNTVGAIRTMVQKVTTVGGKVIIKNNKTEDGIQRNFTYNESNSTIINIESPLTGSDIHLCYVGTTPPVYGKPLTFTSACSTYLTANPGTIFTSDDGYIIGWNDAGTEAALHVSADMTNIKIEENIEITSPTTVVALGTASRSVTFKVLNKSTGEDITSKASLKFTPKYLNKVLPSQYYSVSGSTVTFANTIEPGLYTIAVEATVNGAKYSANHNVEVKEAALKTLSQYTEAPVSGSTVYISSQADITKLTEFLQSNNLTSANKCDILNCVLTNDITLTNFIHIGFGTEKDVFYNFRGTFNGNGHTITVRESPKFNGLFNSVRKDTTIKNLTMAGTIDGETMEHKAAFIRTLDFTGGNATVTSNTGDVVIENCVNKMNILNKAPGSATDVKNYAAGFVTRSTVKLTIKNCRNEGTIAAESHAAGLINTVSGASTIIVNCVNTGNISINDGSVSYAGMAAGICNTLSGNNSRIASCINRGKITGSQAGGIVSNLSTSTYTVNSINYGEVKGKEYAGGITGQVTATTCYMYNCVNISKVTATSTYFNSGVYYNKHGYIVGDGDSGNINNIKNSFYINSYDTSIGGCGSRTKNYTNLYAFTSDGHTSTTEKNVIKPGTADKKENDVVLLLNDQINALQATADKEFCSPWTYDANGLPKLCWEK